ncbi:MAG: zinc ABC transporter solute-binding protein [Campylobacteraceae bacterium]|jgi:zinc transport system substrate-binding protein|nr:zinc ABC transporter solute-binding protein [Campylobacteraceae bacterium]MBT4030881.1 zinc ABC transporter solute-binding protein [Campylobacteraceae bacterium]MBT4572880.1 zinc ABC transporter solute-binding protein [Campylobacteraceae bacterium]MBT4708027.1 zinc ABC transporter solute-binding protein [Campylobacteraceae bacterium]MBT5323425.1 zinc ABC transporter solute-binding protein [Campylobacteraceae bacterium]
MLKKFIILGMLGLISLVHAKINTVVSILPQKTFLKAIGGDKVNIALMVKPGNSPHTYEPKPSQMIDISKADIYFSIGIQFEEAWLPKFATQNKNMKIVNIGKSVKRIAMAEHNHDDEDEHEHHNADHNADHNEDEHEEHNSLDPHIWTSPNNVKIIAKNILTHLVEIDKNNKKYYEKNYDIFINSVNNTNTKIKEILNETNKGTKFMVFHPAWGYFAKQYSLVQVPIEIEGKKPKPRDIIKLIKDAKKQNIKAILTAPEFSDKLAKQIAKELNIPIIKISPLNPKWSNNLINLAKTISNK